VRVPPVFALLAILLGCATPESAQSPYPTGGLEDQSSRAVEEYAVYSSLLEQLFVRPEVGRLIVLDSTARGEMPVIWERHRLAQAPFVDSLAVLDLITAHPHPIRFERRFSLSIPYTLIAEEDLGALFTSGSNGWAAFRARFPDAHGLIRLSRVGLNPTRDQAVVSVRHSYGNLGATLEYVILIREDGKWRVLRRVRIGAA
jgi:hypothetical protein